MTKEEALEALDEAVDALEGDADYVLVIAKRGTTTAWGYRGAAGRSWKELAREALADPRNSAFD
jgi:hypothetical protein